jgi:diamine N-acetyltransferase
MKLRKLQAEDAPFMLEWMHDDSVVHDLRTNFAVKTLEDCISFIKMAQDTNENLHLAIVDENDTYMGTVSLKHITKTSAEFGITVRKCAMGKGFSKFAMQHIIETGFKQLGLQKIYWCVAPENHRAVRFYDKNKFDRCLAPAEAQNFYTSEEITHYIWYAVTH